MESRRKIKRHSGEETSCFPEQVIMDEILPRLPAKSLLKFRCVSKPWCSLIGSKRFIKDHLKHSIKSSWFANNCIFVDYVEKKFKQYSMPSMFDNLLSHPISDIADLGIEEGDVTSPAGCCNGLVCILVNWRRFILWNPTTKKFNNLPDLYSQLQVKCGRITKYGFGFDELSNDYKVFGIVHRLNTWDNPFCMIYSLRSNSWKHIDETDHIPPFYNNIMDMGMYVSGKLHWNNYNGEIVLFDLNKHVSGVVELPSYIKGDIYNIGVLGGCLSVHFVHRNGDLDIWLMKKYGVKESWDKVVTLPRYSHFEIQNPVAIAPVGELLLINNIVVIYNPKCDVLRRPNLFSSYADRFATFSCYLGMYIESLASVAPDA